MSIHLGDKLLNFKRASLCTLQYVALLKGLPVFDSGLDHVLVTRTDAPHVKMSSATSGAVPAMII
jgi:hypothetical protein